MQLPAGLVLAYARLADQLRAEERLETVYDVAAGSGMLKKPGAHIRALQRAARGRRHQDRRPEPTRRAAAEKPVGADPGTVADPGKAAALAANDLVGVGVAVEVVKKLSPSEAAAAGWPVAGELDGGDT